MKLILVRHGPAGDREAWAESGKDEKAMTLAGNVKITNNSGEDYENAQVRLVVGIIRLVDEIAKLAQQGRPGALPQPLPPATAAPAMRVAFANSLGRRQPRAESPRWPQLLRSPTTSCPL